MIWDILLTAYLPTVLIELGVLLLLRERRKKVLLSSIVVNALTNIPLNLYLIDCSTDWWTDVIIGEAIVIIVEMLWYCYFVKDLKQAAIYSVLCNAVSCLLGLLFQLHILLYMDYL